MMKNWVSHINFLGKGEGGGGYRIPGSSERKGGYLARTSVLCQIYAGSPPPPPRLKCPPKMEIKL